MRSFVAISLLCVVVLSGCMSDDWRAAVARERVVVAENVQAAQSAQIDRAQQSDMDRRDAQEMLLALQAQSAMLQSESDQAQALAQVEIAKTIAEAAKPDYMPLMVGFGCLTLVVVVWLLVRGRRGVGAAGPLLLPAPAGYKAYLLDNGTVHWVRLRDARIKVLPIDEYHRITG